MIRTFAAALLFAAITVPALGQNGAPRENTAPPVQNETVQTRDASTAGAAGKTLLVELFLKGGVFMWPILLLLGVGAGFTIERFLHFRKANLNPREFIAELENATASGDILEVEKLCASRDLLLSKIIRKGLKLRKLGYDRVEKSISIAGSIEVASLERGLNIISAISNIAPLLGFLGTVSGMINAFSNIVAADQVNARLVAGGIEEALLTTAFGLIVAIPLLISYNYFVHRIDAFVADVERLTADLLEIMVEKNEKNP